MGKQIQISVCVVRKIDFFGKGDDMPDAHMRTPEITCQKLVIEVLVAFGNDKIEFTRSLVRHRLADHALDETVDGKMPD
jgi:hypothetical protein